MRTRKKKLNKKYFLYIITLAIVMGVFAFFKMNEKPEVQSETKPESKAAVVEKKATPKKEEPIIKDSALLNVPYTVQAPFANWGVHEESCEEAAALMYSYFIEGKAAPTPQVASDEMVAMKNWQVKSYGKEPDLSIEKLGLFMQQYYGYKYQTFKNITKEDVKREISAGHPVLVPVMTQSLKNPHYRPLSVYHILLIKGYDANGVITNDAGIKEGENYVYSWDILFSAVDAQTPKMGQGREMVIVTK